jgi:hypothetical protein
METVLNIWQAVKTVIFLIGKAKHLVQKIEAVKQVIKADISSTKPRTPGQTKMSITWAAEQAASLKFKGTPDDNSTPFELTLTPNGDNSQTNVALAQGTQQLGNFNVPGGYSAVKNLFGSVAAAL